MFCSVRYSAGPCPGINVVNAHLQVMAAQFLWRLTWTSDKIVLYNNCQSFAKWDCVINSSVERAVVRSKFCECRTQSLNASYCEKVSWKCGPHVGRGSSTPLACFSRARELGKPITRFTVVLKMKRQSSEGCPRSQDAPLDPVQRQVVTVSTWWCKTSCGLVQNSHFVNQDW